eukprot:scaffold68194_cov58-Attheya_sp.AAC.4
MVGVFSSMAIKDTASDQKLLETIRKYEDWKIKEENQQMKIEYIRAVSYMARKYVVSRFVTL